MGARNDSQDPAKRIDWARRNEANLRQQRAKDVQYAQGEHRAACFAVPAVLLVSFVSAGLIATSDVPGTRADALVGIILAVLFAAGGARFAAWIISSSKGSRRRAEHTHKLWNEAHATLVEVEAAAPLELAYPEIAVPLEDPPTNKEPMT